MDIKIFEFFSQNQLEQKTSYGEVYVLIKNEIQRIKSRKRNNQSKCIQSQKHDFSLPRDQKHSRGRQREKLHV